MDGWQAELDLAFDRRDDGQTVLTRRRHNGPLRVLKPFYPEAATVCHLYILHPPGGIVGGDILNINVELDAGAHALLTTPAANKFYYCDERYASQSQNLVVVGDSRLEWLPQETIVFNGARAETGLQIDLQGNAQVVCWDIFCFGRPAAGELFRQGRFGMTQLISRDGRPVWRERSVIDGGAVMTAPWGLQGKSVSGTMLATGCTPHHLELLRRHEKLADEDGFSVALIDEILAVRMLADRVDTVRQVFFTAWSILRPALLKRDACHPRIWAT